MNVGVKRLKFIMKMDSQMSLILPVVPITGLVHSPKSRIYTITTMLINKTMVLGEYGIQEVVGLLVNGPV